MRERFPGYYRPSEEEFRELWSSALIVPDTNVLLTLYRLSETTRGKLLEILTLLQERLFVPHQVALEFQRRRIDVIEDQMTAYDNVEREIAGFAAKVGAGMRRHPRLDKEDLERQIAAALAPVKKHLEGVRSGHPDPLEDGDPLGADSVRDALEPLVAGRVGAPRDLDELTGEGRERYEREQPPGWKDKDKPEPQCYGDLAIWLDVIDRARETGRAVIIVTEERKADWWWVRNGELIGPRHELVAEMREKAGQMVYLYNVERFMEEASRALGVEFSADERDDVVRAGDVSQEDLQSLDPANVNRQLDPDNLVVVGPDEHALLDAARHRVVFPDSGGAYSGNPPRQLFRNRAANVFGSRLARRWNASVRTDGSRALLRVAWGEPRDIAFADAENRLTCSVTMPNREVATASRTGTALEADFTYPEDFIGDEAPEAGTYHYTWHYAYPATSEAVKHVNIARGEFQLGLEPGE